MGVESSQPQEQGQWVETDKAITFVPGEGEVGAPVHPFTEVTGLEFTPREHPKPSALDRIRTDEEEQEGWNNFARRADRDKRPKDYLN